MSRVAPSAFYALKAGATRARSVAWHARRHPTEHTGALRILFYHRVADDRDELAVRPHAFRRQMEHLAREGYRVVDVITLADLLEGDALPTRTVALTFDDGFLDVAEHALPVLLDHGFRASVFVSPAVIDGAATFGWYHEQPPLLDWDDVLYLDGEGTLRFEAHTLTHPNLLSLDLAAADREIRGSKLALEARLGRPVLAFSYPSGLYGDRERRLVLAAGFRVAVSCEPGVNGLDVDRFALRRRQIDGRDSMLDFRAKLEGGHDSPLPLRGLYRQVRYGRGTDRPTRSSSRRYRAT
jgi:peptidoglycan/xylan/chitin deacetylase (PgdA/CDA1 family)